MAARALRELGVTTLRFNFRGTGDSGGQFDDGNGERDDLHAVVAWVRKERPEALLWLVGFSFGAYVSIQSSAALEPAALISLAPPAGRWDFNDVAPRMPWLVVPGEEDEVVDPHAVYGWLEKLQPPQLTLVKMPGTSHFFHGKLVDLRGAIKNTARHWLPNPSAE
jgi:Predicted hydrolase of the alpha/beta superfamily